MIRISSKDPSEPSDDKPISGDERGSLSAPAQSRETESNAAGREQLDKQGATRVINDSASIEEIVVTGTHIRGVTDLTVPVSSFSRADIDRRGYLTTQDFVLSLPQNFRGGNNGVSEDGVINSGAGLSNVESASGINLRGLGTGSTLVLINGHRVAPANVGSSVDVSMIPLSAIERIDISVDGASAIYGADAVGGVVNFILRKDYSGAETHLFGGLPTRGGGREHFGAGQTFGRTGDRGGAVLSLQYQSFSDLSTEERDFTADVPDPTDLYPSSRKYSALFNGHHELAENVELFADVLYNHATSERAITAFALPPAWIGKRLEQEIRVVALGHVLHASNHLPLRQASVCLHVKRGRQREVLTATDARPENLKSRGQPAAGHDGEETAGWCESRQRTNPGALAKVFRS